MSKYANELKALLSEDKIRDCLDSLIISLVKTEKKLCDSCILLKARYVKAKEDDRRGFPDKEEINKIRHSLAEIIAEIDEKNISEIEISKIGIIKKRHLFYVGLFVAIVSSLLGYLHFKKTIQEGECYEPMSRTEYLEKQLEYEKQATRVFYVTRALTNAIGTSEFLKNVYEKKLKTDKEFSKEAMSIHGVMENRRDNLEEKITKKEISFAVIIFSEEETFKDTSQIGIVRLKYVLHFVERNAHVKLFMVKKNFLEENFFNDNTGLALILTNKNTNIVLARQATTGKTDIENKVPHSKGIANDRICRDRDLSTIILAKITELISKNSSEKTINEIKKFINLQTK